MTGAATQRVGVPGGNDAPRGWYLYGITTRAPDAIPFDVLECGALAAVVRAVPLDDFAPAVIQERLRTPAGLEEMVRSHNDVIAAVHDRQAILPAKFGSVYPDAEGVVRALRAGHDALVARLRRIDACDEWAVHVYADATAVAEAVASADAGIARLRTECAAARPGRAWFLERRMQQEVRVATDAVLRAVAEACFDRLSSCAADAQVGSWGDAAGIDGDVEILRAAFLVARDELPRFEDALNACADGAPGVRCDRSGPWPPYSFAAGAEVTG